MTIKIYTSADPSTAISDSGDFTNPLLVRMDGVVGGVYQVRLFIRNDNALYSYQNINIVPSDLGDPGLINGSRGITWKLYAGDTQPTDEQWALVTAPNTITMPDLGTVSVSDIVTYAPFWLAVRIPRNTDVQTIKNINLLVTATKTLI